LHLIVIESIWQTSPFQCDGKASKKFFYFSIS
jgi:hypothetical protein